MSISYNETPEGRHEDPGGLASPIRGEPLLSLEGVAHSRGGRLVIKNASLALEGGSALILTGPSGVGKSTLLEIMAGVVAPDAGTVVAKNKAALMFQDDALIPWLTALGNLLYVASPALGPDEATDRALEALATVGLEPQALPGAMSSGMRRRLNLARALYAGRAILLLDEPFAFLDEGWQERVASLIAGEVDRGAAVALSDHGDGRALADLPAGRSRLVEVQGPPVELSL